MQEGRLIWLLLLRQVYYTTPAKKSEGVKGYWCHSCYSEHRGEVIELEGMRVRKVLLCTSQASSLSLCAPVGVTVLQRVCTCTRCPAVHPFRMLCLRCGEGVEAVQSMSCKASCGTCQV